MKSGSLHSPKLGYQRGFTLLEMSAAMGIMVTLSAVLVAMMQQHVLFLQMCQEQQFLTAEAPRIGNLLSRILNSADHYFVFADKTAALGAGLPVNGSGSAVKLYFKSANQTTDTRIISVEPTSTGTALKFYAPQANGALTSWTISSKIASASFLNAEGILSLTLQGPNGEQITYSGGAR